MVHPDQEPLGPRDDPGLVLSLLSGPLLLGVLTTMVDDGWLLVEDPAGVARRYAGSPALVGEPASEVRAVLPSDRSDSVTHGTVADRLDTDRPTAYAALRTTPAARGGRVAGWHLSDV